MHEDENLCKVGTEYGSVGYPESALPVSVASSEAIGSSVSMKLGSLIPT